MVPVPEPANEISALSCSDWHRDGRFAADSHRGITEAVQRNKAEGGIIQIDIELQETAERAGWREHVEA